MTVSGAVISYPWASNLVYRLTGSPVPAGRGGGPADRRAPVAWRGEAERGRGRARRAQRGDGRERTARPEAARSSAAGRPARTGGGSETPAVIPAEARSACWARAEQQVPTWSLLSMRLPNREDGPVAFTITDGAHWNAFARSNAHAEQRHRRRHPVAALRGGRVSARRSRGWLRFAHTGELGGLLGQIIAGIGCLGGVLLVYTGCRSRSADLWNWSLWARLGVPRQPPAVVEPPGATLAREAIEGPGSIRRAG